MEDGSEWLQFLSLFQQGLLVATGIGLIVGLEREFNTQSEESHIAGIRTFPLVAVLGFILGFLSQKGMPFLFPAALFGFFILLSVAYFVQTQKGKLGLSTEMALFVVFVLGGLVSYGAMAESVAVAVVITTLLSLKAQIHRFVTNITQEELFAFIKFILLALLLLPVLPDKAFGPDNLLNYRSIGWVIVIVSTFGFAGYLLLKFVGSKRGILLTALIGGLYSSTMIAWVFAARSRETPTLVRAYGAGIILSSSVMFCRVLLISSFFSASVAGILLVPCAMMLTASLLAVWYVQHSEKANEKKEEAVKLGNPLDIGNALFFGLLYIAVSLFMYYSRQWLGESGAYLSGGLSGIADIDAITISTAQWSAHQGFQAEAANIIVIAMLANTIFKGLMSIIRGHSALLKPLLLGFGGMLVAGLIWLLIWGF